MTKAIQEPISTSVNLLSTKTSNEDKMVGYHFYTELMNDLKGLYAKMQEKLFAFHESNRQTAEREIEEYERNLVEKQTQETEKSLQTIVEEPQMESGMLAPFAKIVEVAIDSPAYVAGIQVGDLVTSYGTLNCFNHNNLKAIPEVTRNSINQPLSVKVKRGDIHLQLEVTPQSWKGAGILGCRFVETTK